MNKSPAFTLAERHNFSILLQSGFVDTFRRLHPDQRAYTWWNMRIGGRKRVGSLGIGRRLDYFLVSNEYFNKVISS